MNGQAQREETLRIAERAAEWLCALEDGGARERAAFAEWVSASPLHLQEFLFMSALESESRRLDPERRIAVDEILARAGGNVIGLRNKAPRPGSGAYHPARQTGRRTWWLGAAAASALLLVAAWTTLISGGERYVTAIGEQRRVELLDGSVVHLNTRSRVEVTFTDSARDIRLLEGEALFTVERDAARPFSVYSGGTVIRAIGTQFNVLRRPSGTTVQVIEGRVRVSTGVRQEPLSIGEEVRVDDGGHLRKRRAPDATHLAAWQRGRLVFRDETLEDIAAEFNRYNRGARIVLPAGEVRSRRYTAVFDADDPDSLLEFLRQDTGLRVEDGGTEILIQADEHRR